MESRLANRNSTVFGSLVGDYCKSEEVTPDLGEVCFWKASELG